MSKGLVVLSGGQDSTTTLWVAKRECDAVHAISFNYGQRHQLELKSAFQISSWAGIASHEVLDLPAHTLQGRSPLTDHSAELETYSSHAEMEKTIGDRVELTFVPMRNALFLTIAANRASVLGCDFIYTGVCQADNANYPDCREDFIRAQERAIQEALGGSDPTIFIRTPLMHITKPESIDLALTMPGCYAALGFSHTAYDGLYPPVGGDHASVLRYHSFEVAGVPDPLVVRAWYENKMDLPATDNYLKFNLIRRAVQAGFTTTMRAALTDLELQIKAIVHG